MKRNMIGIAITVTMMLASITLTSLCNVDNTVKANDTNKTVSYDNIYVSKGTVINTNEDLDIVSVVDCDGEVFEFYGVEDWFVDDNCLLVMNNNNTKDITDDIIIRTIYTD